MKMINDKIFLIIPFLVISLLGIMSFEPETPEPQRKFFDISLNGLPEENHLNYLSVKDTIYVLGNSFVTIDLEKQLATLYRRGEYPVMLGISSGTDRILDGMKTPTGIFTVQSKYKKAISRQFDNAELFWWVGIYGNIGFHGLAGKNYYRHLGKRPSSHGCVRIGREDGKRLFDNVELGTPILIYKNEPARVLGFGDRESHYSFITDPRELKSYFANRLENLYAGNGMENNNFKYAFDSRTVIKRPLDIGDASKIPVRQNTVITRMQFTKQIRDETVIPLYFPTNDSLVANNGSF